MPERGRRAIRSVWSLALAIGITWATGSFARAETHQLAHLTDTLPGMNLFSFDLAVRTDADGAIEEFTLDGDYLMKGEGLLEFIRMTETYTANPLQLGRDGGITYDGLINFRSIDLDPETGGRVQLRFETDLHNSDWRTLNARVARDGSGRWKLYWDRSGTPIREIRLMGRLEGGLIVGLTRVVLQGEDGSVNRIQVSDLSRPAAETAAPSVHEGREAPDRQTETDRTFVPAPVSPAGVTPAL